MSPPVAVNADPSFESERRYGIAAADPASRMWQLKTPPISGIAVRSAGRRADHIRFPLARQRPLLTHRSDRADGWLSLRLAGFVSEGARKRDRSVRIRTEAALPYRRLTLTDRVAPGANMPWIAHLRTTLDERTHDFFERASTRKPGHCLPAEQ
jgi:hypothetical protein